MLTEGSNDPCVCVVSVALVEAGAVQEALLLV